MPRRVDHDERRRHIAAAVWRLASTRGLEGVTLRQVAAEAGVPVRLLQYYFGTRDDLLVGALAILNAEAEREARQRLAGLGDQVGARELVRAVLLELLPLDEPRRQRHLVHAAYFLWFLREPGPGAIARDATPAVEDLLTHLMTEARGTEEVPPEVALDVEAHLLVATVAGLQGQMLLGQRTEEEALRLLDHQLARIFPTPTAGPAGPDGPDAGGGDGE